METTVMENQMEKKMEHEMDTGEYLGIIMGYVEGCRQVPAETLYEPRSVLALLRVP